MSLASSGAPGAGSSTPLLQDENRVRPATSVAVLAAVTVLTGIGAGLGGMLLARTLHFIQHVAYGYSLDAVISKESFLQGVTGAPPWKRVVAEVTCGLVAGIGWWGVYRWGRKLVSIRKAVGSDDPRMPMLTTIVHALLQIVTVALGSPLGREVAPREIGSVFAGWLAHRAGLSVREQQIMVACGAGAGLAAVYNVPLGGAVFVLEVLLGTFSLNAVIPAVATSVIAALVAWIGLGDESQYTVLHYDISASLVTWSILAGPVFGVAAYGFTRLMGAARARAPKDWRLIAWCLGVFVIIGLLAIPFPQLPGNGKGPSQLGFDNGLSFGLAGTLLVLKLLILTGSLRAGAEGGLLTPGLTMGALLATMLGVVWNLVWPGTPLGAFAIVGAGAFLASSMAMPVTAIALIVEFTRVDHDFLVPIFFAIAGSVGALRLCTRVQSKT